jgi:hypothetical protein
MIKRFLILFTAALILIQFIHPKENRSVSISPNDITNKFQVSPQVLSLLKNSCYDCHSNNTNYPWYNYVQPIAWWLQYHVNEGKSELNFSEFGGYSAKKQYHKLKSIVESQRDNWMPLGIYRWLHRDAALSDSQKLLISGWADSLAQKIKVENNISIEEGHKMIY